MSREHLGNIIRDFDPEKFGRFFEEKSPSFHPLLERDRALDDDYFGESRKIGVFDFEGGERVGVYAFQVTSALSERSGKKLQFEKGREILKTNDPTYHAGIFIFSDAAGNFRFSLIYKQFIGTKRTFNHFKRYTYFVSREFTNKTFLQRIGLGDFSSIEKIKEAFAIGPVTDIFYKEFFDEFQKIVDVVREKNGIKHEEPARDFVLLFAIRIVFLGFIQKRKWIGDDERFIQQLFQEYQKAGRTDEFYRGWLSVLFFESLNKKFAPRQYFPRNINDALMMAPYLNGGLFREKPGYDDNGWIIPDQEIGEFFEFLFSHSFTIEENSADDEDLQLNPEFLGIIFERLVNKADGAVYTPRTEVDFMCRLSLVKWLGKNLEVPVTKTNLYELFFQEGESDEDQKEGSFSPKEAQGIVNKLEDIAICDPAAGSGAFLVGMMQVMDEVEQSLKERYGLGDDDAFTRKKRIIAQSLYGVEVKEWAVWIAQLRMWLSLFIEAPESMRLSPLPILPSLEFKVRRGDSLVQRIGSKLFPIEGHAKIQSKSLKDKITKLKNFKIDYFNNDSSVKWGFDKPREMELKIYRDILDDEIREKEDDLRRIRNTKHTKTVSLFGEAIEPEQESLPFDTEEAKVLETEIAELKKQKDLIRGDKPLIWNIEFADIFLDKGGFDIIIGNPPYVRQEKIADPMGHIKDSKAYKNLLQEMVRQDFPDDFPPKLKINAQSDLYTYFYIRGLRLLNSGGVHTFICSNSWLDAGYGTWLQKFLLDRAPVDCIIDNHARRSFDAADVNTIISVIHAPVKERKRKVDESHLVKFVAFKKPFDESLYTENLLGIEDAAEVVSTDVFRAYPITVGALLEVGTEYGSEEEKAMKLGQYAGDKWGGKYLRSPEIFFTVFRKAEPFLRKLQKHLSGERYPNTGGADGFFIFTDFAEKGDIFSVRNEKTLNGTDGYEGVIESEYLVDLIKDVTKKKKNIVIECSDAKCLVIPNEKILSKNLLDYVKWGEKEGYDKRSVTKQQNPWYKPTRQMLRGADVLLPRSFGETFVIHYNPKKLISLRFYRLHSYDPEKTEVLVAYMNTTLHWLIFEALGNKSQGQGVLDFYMDDFLRQEVPVILDSELPKALDFMKRREIGTIFQECGIDPKSKTPIEEQEPNPLPDRAVLDKIVFDALDLSEDERKDVYRAVCRLVWNRISKAKSV